MHKNIQTNLFCLGTVSLKLKLHSVKELFVGSTAVRQQSTVTEGFALVRGFIKSVFT